MRTLRSFLLAGVLSGSKPNLTSCLLIRLQPPTPSVLLIARSRRTLPWEYTLAATRTMNGRKMPALLLLWRTSLDTVVPGIKAPSIVLINFDRF